MNWKAFLAKLAAQILGSVSENLLKEMKDFAIAFRTKAKQTTNPWDDVLADFICGILGVDD